MAAAAILLIGSPAAGATTYGISDPQGVFASCPTSDNPCTSPSGIGGVWRSSSLAALWESPRSLQSVRLPVTYDAVATSDGAAGRQFRGRVTHVCPKMEPKRFSSDGPAERCDVDTREIWIALETTEPPLIGLRVRVALD